MDLPLEQPPAALALPSTRVTVRSTTIEDDGRGAAQESMPAEDRVTARIWKTFMVIVVCWGLGV